MPWQSTDKCELYQSLWHGWVMAYISRKCIGSMSQQTHKDNPFKLKFMSKIERLVSRLRLQNNEELCYENIASLMVHHSNVVCREEISQVENAISNISEVDIIIVVPAFENMLQIIQQHYSVFHKWIYLPKMRKYFQLTRTLCWINKHWKYKFWHRWNEGIDLDSVGSELIWINSYEMNGFPAL